MTPLEKAAEALSRAQATAPLASWDNQPEGWKERCRREARLVAEALFPETPEPERMKMMEEQLEGALPFRKIAARCAYAAERKWIGL